MVREIDVWFTTASTYTYLTVTRLPQVERDSGIMFRWRPFHLVVILREMKHVPFADKPTKSAYMWRDITRRATLYSLAPKLPVPLSAQERCPRKPHREPRPGAGLGARLRARILPALVRAWRSERR